MDNWIDKMAADQAEYKARMISEHRCQCCGVRVESVATRKSDGYEYYPRECNDCAKLRSRHEPRGFGAGQASIHHEVLRRTGYSAAEAGGPCDAEES